METVRGSVEDGRKCEWGDTGVEVGVWEEEEKNVQRLSTSAGDVDVRDWV